MSSNLLVIILIPTSVACLFDFGPLCIFSRGVSLLDAGCLGERQVDWNSCIDGAMELEELFSDATQLKFYALTFSQTPIGNVFPSGMKLTNMEFTTKSYRSLVFLQLER